MIQLFAVKGLSIMLFAMGLFVLLISGYNLGVSITAEKVINDLMTDDVINKLVSDNIIEDTNDVNEAFLYLKIFSVVGIITSIFLVILALHLFQKVEDK